MAVHKPPHRIQMTLQIVERQPELLLLLCISRPKGAKTTPAILKHCIPKGIPTMVTHNTNPPNTYISALISPPNTSQIILPSRLNGVMFYFFFKAKMLQSVFSATIVLLNLPNPSISISTTSPGCSHCTL